MKIKDVGCPRGGLMFGDRGNNGDELFRVCGVEECQKPSRYAQAPYMSRPCGLEKLSAGAAAGTNYSSKRPGTDRPRTCSHMYCKYKPWILHFKRGTLDAPSCPGVQPADKHKQHKHGQANQYRPVGNQGQKLQATEVIASNRMSV